MKGVVLAGGTGSRLNPLTRVTNKHLLPIYDKPMVYYPIQTLVNAGIEEILLVTGGKNAGDFLRLLGNGRDFGLKHLNYTYQEGEGGIAEALGLAEFFAGGEPICVILGDNIIENNICQAVEGFKKQKEGAKILLKEVTDAQRAGLLDAWRTITGVVDDTAAQFAPDTQEAQQINALLTVVERLPANCAPTVITQHMPGTFTTSFAERMNRASASVATVV